MKRKNTNLDQIVDSIIAINPILFKNLAKPKHLTSTITFGAHIVIMTLQKCGRLSMSEIGKKLSIPRPNVTAMIDKLITAGLVERKPYLNDRRIIHIGLTKRGMKSTFEIDKTVRDHIKNKLSVLSSEDVGILSHALHDVQNVLAKISLTC